MADIRIGIIAEAQGFDIGKNLEASITEFYSKRFNISIGFVPVPSEEVRLIRNQSDLPQIMDVLFYPVQVDSFFTPEMKFGMTSVYDSVSTFIISSIPKMTKTPSLSFLNMEGQFSIFWVVSLLAVSMLLALATPKNQNGRPFLLIFVETIWKNFLIFFYEPYSRVEKAITWRVAAMSWLIATTFIFFEISGNLKSDFTEKEYDTVDTIDQLVKQGFKNVWFWDGTDELTSFRKKVNVPIPETSLLPIEDGVFGDQFQNVAKGLGVNRKFMVVGTMLMELILLENQEMENKIQYANKYYFSPSICDTLLVLVVPLNFSQSELMEKANLMIELITENGLFFALMNKGQYAMDLIKWKRPVDDFSTISVKEIESLLSLYFVGNVIVVLALMLEYALFFLLALKKSRTAANVSRRRSQRFNLHYGFSSLTLHEAFRLDARSAE